ncbi:MAG: hypothetical protein NTX82_02495 [Candidatus Parcubacteria bacterium]|nr:hypothetical protein [Candidatus Parcubacteria bacterium]
MPQLKRQYFLGLMKRFVTHWIGNSDIAVEARTFVATLEHETMHLTDDEFKSRLVKWDKILCQAPETVYREYVQSGISFQYANPGHSAVFAA